MKDELKYIILFTLSIILLGLFATIYFVDGQKLSFLILSIVSILTSIGSLILYKQEVKDNRFINRKRKSGKRFK